MATLSPTRLAKLSTLPALSSGSHKSIKDGFCVMEAVSWVAREPWSDHPECACPVISAFLRAWNDALPNNERDELLRPLIVRLVGTKSSKAIEHRRSLMAADWLVRTQTPAWLRLAGLSAQADALATLPEITSMAQIPSIRGPIEAAQRDASAAGDAAGGAAWAAAGAAAWAAAWAAAGDAAWAAAGDAAGDAAWAAAGAAARAAARAAAGAAARAAARAKLAPTCRELQLSALQLVERMISVAEAS
jgi:hypothetical protein